MKIENYIKTIKNTIENVNDEFYTEIEYNGEYCPEFIDVRIVGEGIASEQILNALLNTPDVKRHWNNTAGEYYVEIPTDDEIRFGFSGIRFERITIDIAPEMQNPEFNALLQVDRIYEMEA